jgi:hypothetical protein
MSFSNLIGQKNTQHIHFIPEVSVGYIFDVGFTWGFDLNITALNFDIQNQSPATLGLGLSYNRFMYKRTKLRNWGFNIVGFSDYIFIKTGGNWMKTKWGVNNRNKTTSNGLGINLELGGTINQHLPFFSIRMFDAANPCLWLPLRKQYIFSIKYIYKLPTSFHI